MTEETDKQPKDKEEESILGLNPLCCGACGIERLEALGIMPGEEMLLRCLTCGRLQQFSLISRVIKIV